MRTPFPHQETGAAFLVERGFAFLWDEPGLGKTMEAIMACDRVGARKILVACPAVVRRIWQDEFLSSQTIDRPVHAVEGFPTAPPGDGVTIVSHASLADEAPPPDSKKRRREEYSVPLLKAGAPYDVIIIDEAHEFRDSDAARARNLWMPDGLWNAGRHVWALTGTPVVNSGADLWLPAFGPMRTPVMWWDWGCRYAVMKPDGYNGFRPTGVLNQPELAAFLRPHALRRTIASLGLALPRLDTNQTFLTLPEDALRAAIKGLRGWTPELLAAAMEKSGDVQDAALARVRRALGIAKAPFAASYVNSLLEMGEGPVVAFFHHTDVRIAMFEALHSMGHKVSWIDGKVTLSQFRAAKDWFQAGRLDVLLVQTQAGGVGLTLTRAHRAVVVELPWTAVALNQAIKRIHRITQERDCIADVLRANGCWLEDVLASTVARKDRDAEALLQLLVTDR